MKMKTENIFFNINNYNNYNNNSIIEKKRCDTLTGLKLSMRKKIIK